MHRIYLTLLAFLALSLPLLVTAEPYSSSPMVIVGEGAPKEVASAAAKPVPGAEFPNFPENAITRVGENTTGQHVDAPANPASPTAPTAAAAAASPTNPANPASPPTPASPVNKLWPRDTIQIFMPACAQLHIQLIQPCTCVITKLMVEMPHDEFLKKSEDGTIEQDGRLTRIRTECATTPKQKQ